MGQLGPENGQLLVKIRVLNVEVGAPAAQCLGQRSGPVGGQDHKGDGFGMDGADLRDGDLHLRQQLQKKGFKFLVGLVDLIDEQHHGLFGADGL